MPYFLEYAKVWQCCTALSELRLTTDRGDTVWSPLLQSFNTVRLSLIIYNIDKLRRRWDSKNWNLINYLWQLNLIILITNKFGINKRISTVSSSSVYVQFFLPNLNVLFNSSFFISVPSLHYLSDIFLSFPDKSDTKRIEWNG